MDKLVGAVSRPLKSLWRRASLIGLRGESTDDLSQLTMNVTSDSMIGAKRQREEEEMDKGVGEDGTLNKRRKLATKSTDQEVEPVLGEMALDGPSTQGFPSPSLVSEDGKASSGRTSNARSPPRDKRKQRGLRGTRPEGQTNGPPKLRLGTKRQCAILIGFCGTGCSGMQIQKDTERTIEGLIFSALVKLGAVSEDNADDPMKVHIQRAARTDAGVHAARNVISIKIINEIPGIHDMVSRLNEELPPEIRVWDIVRTQNSFNSRTSCDSRRYNYFLPTYLFIPPAPGSPVATAYTSLDSSYDPASHSFWKENSQLVGAELLAARRVYHVDHETLTRFKTTLSEFVGTHNYWNLTIGREHHDPSSIRMIKSIEVTEPVVYEGGETEWISVVFWGQSFMLHQIRKMVSLALLLTRSNADPTLLRNVYTTKTRLHIPKAPALGLLLEEPLFESYNRKLSAANAAFEEQIASINGKAGKRQTGTGSSSANVPSAVGPSLDARSTERLNLARSAIRPLLSFTPFKIQIEEFKQKHIYADMRSKEEKEGVFDKWTAGIEQGEIELAAGLRGMPLPKEVESLLSQQRSGAARELSKVEVGPQKAGRGIVFKGRYSNASTALLVDSDDEGLSFLDSNTLRSAEMEG